MSNKSVVDLYQLVADTLGVAIEDVGDDSSPDTLSGWDSVSHLNLIMAIEENFDLQLSPEDALENNSVKLLRLLLEEKGKL